MCIFIQPMIYLRPGHVKGLNLVTNISDWSKVEGLYMGWMSLLERPIIVSFSLPVLPQTLYGTRLTAGQAGVGRYPDQTDRCTHLPPRTPVLHPLCSHLQKNTFCLSAPGRHLHGGCLPLIQTPLLFIEV